jgi:hypothetical protein
MEEAADGEDCGDKMDEGIESTGKLLANLFVCSISTSRHQRDEYYSVNFCSL